MSHSMRVTLPFGFDSGTRCGWRKYDCCAAGLALPRAHTAVQFESPALSCAVEPASAISGRSISVSRCEAGTAIAGLRRLISLSCSPLPWLFFPNLNANSSDGVTTGIRMRDGPISPESEAIQYILYVWVLATFVVPSTGKRGGLGSKARVTRVGQPLFTTVVLMEQTFVGFAFGTSLTDTYIDAGQHARNQRNCMNVLLLSMPDYFEHMPPVAVRMPNGALTSLAGNVDSHHRVAVADLILTHREVRNTVTGLVREFDPDVVGLSVMSFQRRTAGRIIDLVRTLKPGVKVVVGGYDPSLAGEAYEGMNVDFIVRGEGEVTFRELLRAVEQGGDFGRICGLSYRAGDRWLHNSNRPVHRLEDDEIRPPNRNARVLQGYTLLGRQVDVIETSRGCTYDCSFCSIIEMRGRNFHTYRFERIL